MKFIEPEHAAPVARLAAVAAALLAASAAHAQSNVTMYGIVDTFVEAADNGRDSITRVESGAIYGSRWGVRGREDLGDGLAAFFGLEAGLNNDTGALGQGGLAWGRLAQVGLQHATYGQLSFGRQYTPVHNLLVTYTLGGGLAFGNAGSAYAASPTTSIRNDNSVLYVSPKLAGFVLKLMASAGEGTTGRATSGSLAYEVERLSITGAYYDAKAPRGTLGTAATNPDDHLKITTLGASYDFGVAKVAAVYQRARNDNDAAAFRIDQDWWSLGALIPVGPQGTLLVDYGQFSNDAVAQGDSRALGVRYEHALSKRTSLYAGVAKIRNERAAAFRVNGSGNQGVALGAPGADPRSMIAGVYHRF